MIGLSTQVVPIFTCCGPAGVGGGHRAAGQVSAGGGTACQAPTGGTPGRETTPSSTATKSWTRGQRDGRPRQGFEKVLNAPLASQNSFPTFMNNAFLPESSFEEL